MKYNVLIISQNKTKKDDFYSLWPAPNGNETTVGLTGDTAREDSMGRGAICEIHLTYVNVASQE